MTSTAHSWPRDVFLLKLMNPQVQKIQDFPNTHRHTIFGDRMNMKELTPSLFKKKDTETQRQPLAQGLIQKMGEPLTSLPFLCPPLSLSSSF